MLKSMPILKRNLADFAPEIDVALLGPQVAYTWINQKRFVRQPYSYCCHPYGRLWDVGW